MVDLYDRLLETSRYIIKDTFIGSLIEYISGYMTRQQIIDLWEFETEAQVDLNALCDNIDKFFFMSKKLKYLLEIESVCFLCLCSCKYTTRAEFKTRLGI